MSESRIATQELDDTALDGVSGGVTVDVALAGQTLATVNAVDGLTAPLAGVAHGVTVAADTTSLVGVNVTL